MEGAKLIGLRGGKAPKSYTEDIWARRPQDVLGRHAPRLGIDHGVEGKVLIKDLRNGFMLVWRRGHTAWSGVGSTAYNPTYLEFYGKEELRTGLGRELHQGGRLSARLIAGLESKINEVFGYSVAHLYLPNHTVFIKEMKK